MSEFDSLFSAVNDHSKQIDDLIKNFRESMKTQFRDLMHHFFAESPQVSKIEWTQYTPSFNDGDPCYFRVGEIEFFDQDEAEISLSASEESYKRYIRYADEYKESQPTTSEYYLEEAAKVRRALDSDDGTIDRCSKIKNFINGNSDLMDALFGDPARVTVTAESVEVDEEYDCGY